MKYNITIEGMSCSHCEKRVNEALKKIKGVSVESVSAVNKQAIINSKKAVDEQQIKEAIKNIDFKFVSVKEEN